MSIDYDKLGKRICSFRTKQGLTQDDLAEKSNLSRDHIYKVEVGKRTLSLDSLVAIANALGTSSDDLLVDSLEHPTSTSGSELHRLLLDCNEIEEEILTRTVKELKAILYGLGI
ncbi:MAG: helix-turn-helix domain-containing protein [Lachnospiraceae bacterium]|nr:helix-turn-helix domain-containing protein [Clostridiales bacterium]MCD7750461.1 helix-turn-helix domain-containing protein [Lachnospiraceae bacterium]